ncbi:hypothetical protein BH18ACT5_BH18ACT5_03320 [soil metagenome]
MSKTVEIDRRMLRRRREVAEGRARSNLSRLGLVLISAALIALGVWLFRSPLFAVQQIDVVGAIPHLVDEIRAQSGIDLGQPLVTVRPGQVEKQLTANPWVLSSRVELSWPDRVVIAVEPRLPVAWISNGVGQWALVGIDGVVLDTASQPGTGMPQVQIDPARQALLLGGLEFASNIDPLLFGGATIEARGEELWAIVGGYSVRLGRALDMAEKARTLNTILTQGLAPGSIVNLIAPARPAIVPPTG